MSNSSDQLTPTNRSTVNGPVSQLPFSPDLIEKLYNEKCQQIAETRTRLTKIAESAKSEFDMVNFQIPFQLDSVETNCNDKVNQITLLRTELIEMIEKANNKYNELKAFQ
ncbi:hypothetical protein RhiirA5_171368 [Rhizophagus irregularis]|nr:hypothetical protein RhiirA5_171368 [Rhizophagus irregularis]